MSSIISDIFYGSKQNLLDNYLINRFEKEPQLSQPYQQHRTAIHSSSLHFAISVPVTQDFKQNSYNIKVQLGKRCEEVMISLGGRKKSLEILIELNDLKGIDLSRYSNIKISISEGKYKGKVFGYIPIQTIKSIMAQMDSQKTITLPLKGKRFIGFSTIKCTIKADFTQDILNSNILGSIDKEKSQHSYFNFNGRGNEVQQISGIPQNSSNIQIQKPTNVRKYRRISVQKPNKQLRSQSKSRQIERYSNHGMEKESNHRMEKYYNKGKIQKKLQSTKQFIKQILSVPVIFNRMNLNKLDYPQQNTKFQQNGLTFGLGQQIQLSNITQQGVNIDVYADDTKIGRVHLNVLFLTMADFKGELPIYNQNQQFVGTVLVCSPSVTFEAQNTVWKSSKGKLTQVIRAEEVSLQKTSFSQSQMNNLVVLSIQKIVMTNLSKELINGSFNNINQHKAELFDFVKMQATGRLELIVRINQQVFRFKDINLRYIIDSDQIQVVQLKRRQGFIVSSWQKVQAGHTIIQMELYSNHRLLCYSKSSFPLQTTAAHYFTAAKTDFPFTQSVIYCRYIQIQAAEQYFQLSRLSQIKNIIQQLVEEQLRLLDLSDQSIKQIMNINKKIAYVQVKKLFNLIQPHFSLLTAFQQTNISTVFGDQPHSNQLIAQINTKLLRQFVLSDTSNISSIGYEEFRSIVQFFTNKSLSEIQQSCDLLMNNCIKNIEGRVLYPLFVAGLYLRSQPPLDSHQNKSTQENHLKLNITAAIIDQTPNEVFKQVLLIPQKRCFIQSIQFRNLHLLNQGKIPNVSISIAKKIHYSNANPEFIIEKEINMGQAIRIYHKNIAQNSLQLLVQFIPVRRRSLYQIDMSGKVTAKILWGN